MASSPPIPKRPQTSKQAKRAYQKRGNISSVSEVERKRLARLNELDRRAEAIHEKERRRKANNKKRAEKEAEEKKKRKIVGAADAPAKVSASQMRLGVFLVHTKGKASGGEDEDEIEVPQVSSVAPLQTLQSSHLQTKLPSRNSREHNEKMTHNQELTPSSCGLRNKNEDAIVTWSNNENSAREPLRLIPTNHLHPSQTVSTRPCFQAVDWPFDEDDLAGIFDSGSQIQRELDEPEDHIHQHSPLLNINTTPDFQGCNPPKGSKVPRSLISSFATNELDNTVSDLSTQMIDTSCKALHSFPAQKNASAQNADSEFEDNDFEYALAGFSTQKAMSATIEAQELSTLAKSLPTKISFSLSSDDEFEDDAFEDTFTGLSTQELTHAMPLFPRGTPSKKKCLQSTEKSSQPTGNISQSILKAPRSSKKILQSTEASQSINSAGPAELRKPGPTIEDRRKSADGIENLSGSLDFGDFDLSVEDVAELETQALTLVAKH